jgi:hypothetical protein
LNDGQDVLKTPDPGVFVRDRFHLLFFPARAKPHHCEPITVQMVEELVEYIEEATGFNQDYPSVCEDVESEVVIRQTEVDRDCSVYEREITTTTFSIQRRAACKVRTTLNSLLKCVRMDLRALQMAVCYAPETSDDRHPISSTSSATEYCDPTLCDQYRRRFGASSQSQDWTISTLAPSKVPSNSYDLRLLQTTTNRQRHQGRHVPDLPTVCQAPRICHHLHGQRRTDPQNCGVGFRLPHRSV